MEQYACKCGNRNFEIFAGYIKCTKCGEEYKYYLGYLPLPQDFNGRRQVYVRKEFEKGKKK